MGHGQLGITVDDPRALVFVNGELRGTGKASVPELVPGTYRVFVQVPGSDGRQYHIAVHAGDVSTLEVHWQLDSALTISDTWAGFAYASEAERARGPVQAAGLARHWGLDALVVVDAMLVDGEQAVQGTVYRSDGTIARSALVVPSGDPTRLYALASYLADGTPSGGLRVATVPGSLDVSAHDSNPGGDQPRRAAWSLVAGGAVAIGVGIGLLAIDQDFGHTDAQGVKTAYYRDTAPFGIAAGVAGAASIGLGLWLMRTRPHRAQPSVFLAPSRFELGWTVHY
jgi:hypothetical protein